jgi:hypothetical protein
MSILLLAFDSRHLTVHVEHAFAERPEAKVWLSVVALARYQVGEGVEAEEIKVHAHLERQTRPLIEPPRLMAEGDHWSADLVLPASVIDMLEQAIARGGNLRFSLMLKADGDPRRAPLFHGKRAVVITDMHLKVATTSGETQK